MSPPMVSCHLGYSMQYAFLATCDSAYNMHEFLLQFAVKLII
jgi:hypothetical protein